MDLFELLGRISIKNNEANDALDETSEKGKETENKLGKAFSAVGKGAVVAGKAIVTGMAAGGAAVTALVTKSIQSYADYEQLVGGVDTLFKESSAKVQEYAANAFKTAGMSANEYMDTVTSFSASLLAGLDGDTVKAAEIANRAITDMSDNANKMGTDITMIQNAYQGFAKQNYTMLDNLKLGYGGTQGEMARLINDSGVLGDTMQVTADTVNQVSFDKIIEAIGVVQDKMGITGTTAKEAASTISGSIASMKSAWQNMLTAISSDELPFDTYVDQFVNSVSTVAENLLPRIEIALNGVVQLVDKLGPVLVQKVPELLSTLLPSVITATTSLINSIVAILPSLVSMLVTETLPQLLTGIGAIFNTLVSALPTLIQSIVTALPVLIPQLIDGLVGMITSVAQMLPQIIRPLLAALPEVLMSIQDAILQNLPILIDGLTTLIMDLVNMIPAVLPELLNMVIQLVRQLMEQLPVILPLLVQALVTIITQIGQYLPELIPQLVNALVIIINILTEQLPVIIPMLIDAIVLIVQAIIEQLPGILLALINALPPLLKAVWDAIVMVFMNLPQWFGQLFKGAVKIIGTEFSAVGEFFAGIWEKVKGVFAPVIKFFDVTFGNAFRAIKAIFQGLGQLFLGIWQAVKGVFAPVVSYFRGKFNEAWTAIKNVFSGVKTFFLGIWDTIKTAFSTVGTKIGDAISGAVKGAINGVIGSAENIINGFLGMINNAIGAINKIPGVNVSKVKLVSFTRLAEGGVVDKPTPALFGEDGAEAVVPLENNTGWINKVARQLHEFTISNNNDLAGALSTRSIELQERQMTEMQTMNSKLDRIIELLARFFPDVLDALVSEGFIPDDRMVAKWLAPAMDSELGTIAIKRGRGRG